ncbi:helix-turn-helix transcriptional regulator [Alteromonas sp. a30]|uniref:helix-turn-helix transcriptional regulator n=1 Tax=Alteromonas sp. a30 TaxID=2730917 RepID=UPI0022813560|nr:helix-turn-helix transcriptional regulator [Alteromonas sp. a30]MCY7296444.1 helix-turn-helix transcriptional regulator [Alteromonas sp. a30]
MHSDISFSDVAPVTGADLKNLRVSAGLTTSQMAKAAGVKNRKTYENWEKGLGTPNVNQFFYMVKACGVDMEARALFQFLARNKDKSFYSD